MPRPDSKPRPMSSWPMDSLTAPPRPPVPTMPAMTTMDRPSMITWLTLGHDGRQGERQLDAQQGVARSGAERLGRLDQLGVDLADAEFGHAHAGGDREDQGGDDTGGHAQAEEQDRRDQQHHRRHRLEQVQDGPHDGGDGLGAGRPDAHGHADDQGDHGGDEDQGQGRHRPVPQGERVDEREAREGEDTGGEAAQPPGEDGEDARHQQRRRAAEDGVDAVVHAFDDRLDGVEEPGHVVDEPAHAVVDPVTEVDPRHG